MSDIIEVKNYKCSLCDTIYSTEADAQNCYDKHIKTDEITILKGNYVSLKDDKTGAPSRIKVQLGTDTTNIAWYKKE